MHSYSIDSSERTNITVFLALLSVLLAWLCDWFFVALGIDCWWVSPPSTMGIFWLLHWVFNQYLWALPLPQVSHLSKVPDMRGEWQGVVRSTHDGGSEPVAATLVVDQTWTRILFILRTSTSSSRSYVAHLCVDNARDVRMHYLYMNRPATNAACTMHMHDGTAMLQLSADGATLTGEYYCGRDRQNQGSLEFHRIARVQNEAVPRESSHVAGG